MSLNHESQTFVKIEWMFCKRLVVYLVLLGSSCLTQAHTWMPDVSYLCVTWMLNGDDEDDYDRHKSSGQT